MQHYLRRSMSIFMIFTLLISSGLFAPTPAKAGSAEETYVWTLTSSLDLYAITYGNGLYVGIGNGLIHTSPDLVTWTQQDVSAQTTKKLNTVKFLNGKFYAATSRDDGKTGANFIYSSNGTNWSAGTSLDDYVQSAFSSISYGDNKYMATTSNGGGIVESSTGIAWSNTTVEQNIISYRDITYVSNRFVAVGNIFSGDAVVQSTNNTGTTWEPVVKLAGVNLYGIASDGSQVIAVGDGGKIFRTDATTSPLLPTVAVTSPVNDDLTKVAYDSSNGGLYVAVGYSNAIITSSDGVNWKIEAVEAATIGPYIDVIFGENTFVAVGYNGVYKRVLGGTVSAAAATPTPGVGVDDAITLTVKDALGNTDTTFSGVRNVTISGYLQAPDGSYGSFNGTALSSSPNTISVTFANGVATANLKLNKAEAQTIGLSVVGVATPAANTLSITPVVGSAASMDLTTNVTAPTGNGGVFAQQPAVTLRDAYGNTSVNDSTTVVTVSKKDAGTWTLTGTATATASSGVATFTGLGATNAAEATGAQLAFDAGIFAQITSADVTLPAPAPAPAQTVSAAAAASTPGVGVDDEITLTVKDALGNTDTTFSGARNVTISGYLQAPDGSYGSFNGTALSSSPNTISVTFANGVATENLKLNKAAAQTISLSVAGVTTPATNTLSITPVVGSAASMELTTDVTAPTGNGGVFAQQPAVTLRDAYGNTSVNDSTTVVTVSKKDTGTWTLTGTATATASSGVATFTGLGATNAAGATGAQLAFDAGIFAQITSAVVTLPAPAPAQTVSAAVAAPTPGVGVDDAITLTVKDALGNTDTTFSGVRNVTISGYLQAPDGSYGSFNGTALSASPNTISVTFTSGVATENLKLNKAAAQTISLSVAGVTTPATNTLSITPVVGSAASMELTTDVTAPAGNGGAFAQQPVVTLRDAYGNTSVNDSTTVVTVSKKDAGTWTLTGTATATASSGVATFTGLGATNEAEVTGAQLAYDAGSLPQITSADVTLPWPITTAPRVESVVGGDGHALLNWSEVYGSVSYAVYQSTASGTFGEAVATVTGSVYDYTATGLTNGTTYYFIVRATNPGGDSAVSNEVSVTPVTVPSAPTNVTATAGNGTATVSFTAPASDGGSPITLYTVTSNTGGLTGMSTTASPITVTGLSNGMAYTFTVIATNGVGSSLDSSPSNRVLPINNSGGSPSSNNGSISSPIDSTNGNLTLPLGSTDEVSLDEAIFIRIPANATSKPLEINIEKVSNTQNLFAHNEVPASSVFDIHKNIPENLNKPATLIMVFNPSQVNSNQTVAVFYYNEATKTWVKIENGKIDSNRISVQVNNFMKFAVLVVDGATGLPIAAPTIDESKEVNFSDISGHWAASDINKAVQSGIVNGYLDGTFRPNNIVTRAEFVVMLMKALKPQAEAAKLAFTDSAKIGTWAQKAIEQAVQAGIVNGYSDGSFRPAAEITRTEMAVMIAKALALNVEANVVTDFVDDAEIPNWAKGQVAAMKNLGLISGKGTNKFAPNDKATRAEAVTILLKMIAQKGR